MTKDEIAEIAAPLVGPSGLRLMAEQIDVLRAELVLLLQQCKEKDDQIKELKDTVRALEEELDGEIDARR